MRPSKPHSDACDRNRAPILEVLRNHFASRRRVLEVGSGTGQHAAYFAAAMPWLIWQATDVAAHLPGIEAWRAEAARPNLPPPIALDVGHGPWPRGPFDAVFSANTLHIMGWREVEAFFAALPSVLATDATVVVYGPFNEQGRYTSDGNRVFDAWLKARDPRSGIRDAGDVDALARGAGLRRVADVPMPANNRCLVWQRA